MKIKTLTVGPIVGVTTKTSTRIWGRADFDTTSTSIRRCFGVARIRRKGKAFKKRVFLKVRQEYANESQNHYGMTFAAGFASIAVFTLALWFMAGIRSTDPVIDHPQVIPVAMNQSQSIRIVFNADAAIQQAELSVYLPDNVRLVGYPGRDKISWQTSLLKGQNILTLPVMTTTEGRGELRTQLTYHNKVKTYHFVVEAEHADTSGVTHYF